MSLAAHLALERLTDDDSRTVAAAATAALETRPEKRTTEHGQARADAERQAREEAERRAKADAERRAREEAERQAQEEIRKTLAIIVEEIVGTSADEVRMDADIRDDLDIDSLAAIELVMEAQERFNVVVSDAHLGEIRTVRDAVELIRELQGNRR
jgi:acyl carrier protein